MYVAKLTLGYRFPGGFLGAGVVLKTTGDIKGWVGAPLSAVTPRDALSCSGTCSGGV